MNIKQSILRYCFLFPVAPIFANGTSDPIIARVGKIGDSVILPAVYFWPIPSNTVFYQLLGANQEPVNSDISTLTLTNITVFLDGSYQEKLGRGFTIVIPNPNRTR